MVRVVAMPHVPIPIVYVLFGCIPPWVSLFEWLPTVLALFGLAVIQIFDSPAMRQWFALSAER
jgi:hypothetical protein